MEKAKSRKEARKVIRINDTKLVDTGGGFYMEEEEGKLDDVSDAHKMDAVSKS